MKQASMPLPVAVEGEFKKKKLILGALVLSVILLAVGVAPMMVSSLSVLQLTIVGALVLMVALPIFSHIVDEQIGYFFFAIGAAVLWVSMKQGVVGFEAGAFVQHTMGGHKEPLIHVMAEPLVLMGVFGGLQILSFLLRKQITKGIGLLLRAVQPQFLVAGWILLIGSFGALSVVVVASLGGTFFSTVQKATKKDLTASVITFSAAIGISALLLTIGEPLSLFIAKNLGEGSGYLLRTYSGMVAFNSIFLAVVGWWTAKRAPDRAETVEEAMVREVKEAKTSVHVGPSAKDSETVREVDEAAAAVKRFEKEEHNFGHELDQILHKTMRLGLFVWGLLLFGEAAKAEALAVVSQMGTDAMFFGNSLSMVADNALLGLLEVTKGMDQITVLALGISLAFWGVGLPPGNVCNIVLKEQLNISFAKWAKYGVPLAIVLAAVNFVLLKAIGSFLVF